MENLLKAFNEIKQKKLSIDLTRGKPHSDQLDLSNDLMTTPVNPIGENNVDLRNYGEPIGIIEACLLYTSPSPRDKRQSRMPSSA